MTTHANAACELLDRQVVTSGGRIAIYYGQERISYRRLWEQVNRFGNVLRQLGVRAGERVLIALPDRPECIYGFLGAIRHGAWPVPVSPLLSESTYAYMLNDSGAAVVLTTPDSAAHKVRAGHLRHVISVDDESFTAQMAAASAQLEPHPAHRDDIAFLLYTSGSSGDPKGVPHRHGDMPFTADVYGRRILRISEEDLSFSASKLFFAYGLGNSLSFPLRAGAAVVLYPGKCTAPDVFGIIGSYRPTLFFGVPALYSMMLKVLDETASLDSLRLCVSAGEALPASVFRRWKSLTGLEIVDGIGSTEALHIFISNRPDAACPGVTGSVVPPYEARLVDNAGRLVAAGEPGHLQIRGQSTAPFYWNLPAKTSETMLDGGWLRTGDVFVEHGPHYAFLGRSDDMFKVDAHWVSPALVEGALREHAAVLDCALTWRTLEGLVKPLAHVVLNPGFVESMELYRELRAHTLQRVPEYMCPVQIVFCAGLPQTETGKTRRHLLRSDPGASGK